MLEVMRLQSQFVNRSGGGDQCVAQFDSVAFSELPQVAATALQVTLGTVIVMTRLPGREQFDQTWAKV